MPPIESYPLRWPEGWKRIASHNRKRAAFNKATQVPGSYKRLTQLSVADGIGRVLEELKHLGIVRDDVIISTNIPTRLDGMPRSDKGEPSDPGVAVYWRATQKAPMRCMPVDRYDRVADNLAAVAATLEAMRAIKRHGGSEILDRAFTGFAALPQYAGPPWREVLGYEPHQNPPLEMIEAAYKVLTRKAHPDAGGSEAKMQELNIARDQARAEMGGKAGA